MCAKMRTIKFDDCRLEIALKNFAIVNNSPRIEVTAIIPITRNEIC